MKPLLLALLLAGCSLGGPRIQIKYPECGYFDLSGQYVACGCTKKKPCEAYAPVNNMDRDGRLRSAL